MASLLNVRLNGLDALSLGVKYLQKGAQTGLRLGVDEAAGLFEAAAKANAPVDTGRLRDSIHTAATSDTAEKQERNIAPDTPYARRIEYGFIGPDSLGRMFHQPAQPYMRPAFDTERDRAAAAIKDSVYAGLDEAMNQSSMKGRR
jgi:HK97 gp10 family phage protein